MLLTALAGAVTLAAASPEGSLAATSPARVLMVTVTKGYRHDTIPDLARVVTDLARESGAFVLDRARTDDELKAKTTAEALDGYDGIVFASTTGDLPVADRDALLRWIEDGHAFIGIHAATDTFHGFPPYLDLIGGEFATHGKQVSVRVRTRDRAHPATRGLEPGFDVFDEIYEFKRFDPARVHVLLGLDAHPQTGAPGSYPLAWTRQPGRGRVFYTALGHRADVIASPWFRTHLEGGILWALGRARNQSSRRR